MLKENEFDFMELERDQFVERSATDDQISLLLNGECRIDLELERIFST